MPAPKPMAVRAALYCSHSHQVMAYHARRQAGVPINAKMQRVRSFGNRPRVLTAREQSRVEWFRAEAAYWHRQAVEIGPTFAGITDKARAEWTAAMTSYEHECLAVAARIEAGS